MSRHPLIDQARFARSELVRGLEGVTDEEARRRIGRMNSISWIIGHLANQEQRYWLQRRGEPLIVPGLNELVGYAKPATTPPLDEMWAAWRAITSASNSYLDSLTTEDLQTFFAVDAKPGGESIGTLLLRLIGHYWFHIGEAQAIRQLLGHSNLCDFVGNVGVEAPYRPE